MLTPVAEWAQEQNMVIQSISSRGSRVRAAREHSNKLDKHHPNVLVLLVLVICLHNVGE